MSFEAILISYLQSRPALTTLIGSRIYPAHAPDAVQSPYCVYVPITIETEYAHDGAEFSLFSIQISVFAASYASACAVRDVLMSELSGLRATIGTSPNTADIVSLHQNTLHRYESDSQLHHSIIEFEIAVSE